MFTASQIIPGANLTAKSGSRYEIKHVQGVWVSFNMDNPSTGHGWGGSLHIDELLMWLNK